MHHCLFVRLCVFVYIFIQLKIQRKYSRSNDVCMYMYMYMYSTYVPLSFLYLLLAPTNCETHKNSQRTNHQSTSLSPGFFMLVIYAGILRIRVLNPVPSTSPFFFCTVSAVVTLPLRCLRAAWRWIARSCKEVSANGANIKD